MSKSLDAARALLPEATSLANCVEAAVRAAMEGGSCWGNAPSACETTLGSEIGKTRGFESNSRVFLGNKEGVGDVKVSRLNFFFRM